MNWRARLNGCLMRGLFVLFEKRAGLRRPPPICIPEEHVASGPVLMILVAASVVFIVLMAARVNLNPFLVLLLTAFGVGFLSGMPPATVVSTVTGGFGSILGTIGIVIIAGTIIGTVLEKSRATLTLAETVLGLVGRTRAALAMSLTGAVVSISVFCDSGFVILSPLNRTLARRTGTSMSIMAVALSTGLYATHTLVPPTPGPIAAAGNLGADIGLVILLGLVVSVPTVLAGFLWAAYAGRRYYVDPGPAPETSESTARPGIAVSFGPILVPIALITLRSVAGLPMRPFGESGVKLVLDTLGDPTVALLIGVFLSFRLLPRWSGEYLNGWVMEGLAGAGAIIMITGAGGAFGAILKATGVGEYLGTVLAGYRIGIFLPFVIAAALKTAQGSTTVALITTSALTAPLLGDLGLAGGLGPALTVCATGAGGMIVSHANDSYFWVVSQFSGLDPATAYKTHTMATLVMGVTAMACVFVLTLVIL